MLYNWRNIPFVYLCWFRVIRVFFHVFWGLHSWRS
jgi:hypothetical protein